MLQSLDFRNLQDFGSLYLFPTVYYIILVWLIQVAYWQDSAEEDWLVGRDLISRMRVRHGLFFIHLALEKLLKAHVCRKTQEIAPRLHNLSRLAEIADLELNPDQLNILSELSVFNIEGRYPGSLLPIPSFEQAKVIMEQALELYQWLISPLKNR